MRIALNLRLVAGLAVIATPFTASADDFAPPPWRGEPLSAVAEWEFLTPPQNWFFIPPDAMSTTPGTGGELFNEGFATHAEVDLASNWMWTPADGDGGITPATGVFVAGIAFKMANWIDLEPIKYLRAQITWSGQIPPQIFALTGYEEAQPLPIPFPGSPAGDPVTIDGNHFYYDWIILPNPDWEVLEIDVHEGTVLDEIIIDTWSVPAPGALAIFGVALAGISNRKR